MNFLLAIFLTVNSPVVCSIMFFVLFCRIPFQQTNLELNQSGHLVQ
jgi:hypothetical protein